MDFDGPYHGNEGRIPVRRIFPDLWNGYSKAASEALANAGYEYLPDQNGEFKEGYFPITSSNAYERRVSAAIGYLDPGTRLRAAGCRGRGIRSQRRPDAHRRWNW